MESKPGKNRFEKHPGKTLILIYLFFLLISEISVRLYIKFSSDPVTAPLYYNLHDEKVHHDFFPNVSFVVKPSKTDHFKPVNMEINSLGIRGPELKTKSLYRVLNIGDSFLEAREVDFEDTLGDRLNAYFKGKVEFISHGMGSWAPTTEFSWLYHKGIGLTPDEVNLFLCVNDFFRCEVYNRADECYRKDAIYDGIIPVGYSFSYSSPPSLPNIHRFILFRHRIKLYTFMTQRIASLPFVKKPIIEEMRRVSETMTQTADQLRYTV